MLKMFSIKMEEEEIALVKKAAHRHEMTTSEYVRTLLREQLEREKASSFGEATITALAEQVLEDNRPYDTEWLKYINSTRGKKGIAEIARTTTEGYASPDCPSYIIEQAANIVTEELNTVIQEIQHK